MHTAIRLVAISTIALNVAACSSPKVANKSNFSRAIQTYLDTKNGLCAAIPGEGLTFTLVELDMVSDRRGADALVEAGLLSKRATEVKHRYLDKMVPGTEYQTTKKGKKFLVPKGADRYEAAFCTGRYKVVSVDNFTEPSDMMGAKISRVTFRYTVEDAEDWARSEGVLANYRNFAKQTQGDISESAALILTNDGWLHERMLKL